MAASRITDDVRTSADGCRRLSAAVGDLPPAIESAFKQIAGGALLITEHLSPDILDPLVQIVDPTVLPQLRRVANFTKKVMKA